MTLLYSLINTVLGHADATYLERKENNLLINPSNLEKKEMTLNFKIYLMGKKKNLILP